MERVFDGKTQLTAALRPLVEAAEQTLDLDEEKRKRTILRVDSGGGSVADVNWMLAAIRSMVQGNGISTEPMRTTPKSTGKPFRTKAASN